MTEVNKTGILNKITGFFKNEKAAPSAAEVLWEIDEQFKQSAVNQKLLGKNALLGVQNGDLRITLPKYEMNAFYLDSDYKNFTEVVVILQHSILTYIDQEIKTEEDPATINQLKADKKELLKNLGNFGPTTSYYLKKLHNLAGLGSIPAPSKYDHDEIARLTQTKKGDAKFNFLSLAIIRRGLEAARRGGSFKEAVRGMFDSRNKIRKFQEDPKNKVSEKNRLKLKEYTPINPS